MWSSLMDFLSLLHTVALATGIGLVCGVVFLVLWFVHISVQRAHKKQRCAQQWAVYDREMGKAGE